LQPQQKREGHDGLTERESSVLDTLVRLGGSSRLVLAEHVGVALEDLTETIERLELLGYTRSTSTNGKETLHAVAQNSS